MFKNKLLLILKDWNVRKSLFFLLLFTIALILDDIILWKSALICFILSILFVLYKSYKLLE